MGARVVNGLLIVLTLLAADRPDIVLADFEGNDFGGWTATGDAFGGGPATGTLPGQQPVSNYRGRGYASSFHGGDGPTGELLSPPFPIERRFMNFLIGGGRNPGKSGAALLLDGKRVREASGTATTAADDEHLSWRTWDVGEFEGKTARFVAFDRAGGSWGHVMVDQVELSHRRRQKEFANDAIELAMTSVAGATERAQSDPIRPIYHVAPPALWCNDPNGPIHHGGDYHLFYQHNPYGDRWEHMHWGHAKSKDLVHWEHLPIALWPSKEAGEDHCFSGCSAVNERGEPMLLYTSIGKRDPEQWAALPADPHLFAWKKHRENPILTLGAHGSVAIDDWRDPFVFDAPGGKWMAAGGHRREGKGCVCLYEATDGSLLHWKFRGIGFEGTEANWECPNLFRLGGGWMLIYSPHDLVRYHVCEFDPAKAKLTSKAGGCFDYGRDFYATSACQAPDGRWLVWGWIRGFPRQRGWAGCLSLPRVVSVSDDGRLLQRPAAELEKLRQGPPLRHKELESPGSYIFPSFQSTTLELQAEVTPGKRGKCGVRVLCRECGCGGKVVFVDEMGLEVDGKRADPPDFDPDQPRKLRLFLDRSVLEVFLGDDIVLTTVVADHHQHDGVEIFAEGKHGVVHDVRVWRMGPAFKSPD